MIRIKGKKLSVDDKAVIRMFVIFCMEMFLSKQQQKRVRVTIRFVHPKEAKGEDKTDLIEYKAWMVEGNTKHSYEITVNSKMLHKSKHMMRRMKNALQCIGHEMIHVKQYMNGELKDLATGETWHKGQRYKDCDADEKYWFAPWELEAYSYEQGLPAVFKKVYDEIITK